MINKDTRAILKSLISVNNSMIIEPTMHGADEFRSVLYRANLSELEDDIQEFGIFDTTAFLSSLDLLDEPVISLEGNMISASDANSTLKFVTSDVSALEDIVVKPAIIDSTLKANSVMEFTLTAELLGRLKKASGVFKTFDTLFIVKNDESTQLKMGSKDSFSKSNNSFAINVEPTLDEGKTFELPLPLESLLKVPAMDYTLQVKYNEAKDAYRVVLENALLVFVMTLMK